MAHPARGAHQHQLALKSIHFTLGGYGFALAQNLHWIVEAVNAGTVKSDLHVTGVKLKDAVVASGAVISVNTFIETSHAIPRSLFEDQSIKTQAPSVISTWRSVRETLTSFPGNQ